MGGDAVWANGTSHQLTELVRMKFIDPKPEPYWLDHFGKSSAGQRDRVTPKFRKYVGLFVHVWLLFIITALHGFRTA